MLHNVFLQLGLLCGNALKRLLTEVWQYLAAILEAFVILIVDALRSHGKRRQQLLL